MMERIQLAKSPVRFDEEQHRYWLGDVELKGVTSTLIHRAFPDKYKDIDPEVLANAARKGKELHAEIEYFDNFGPFDYDELNERIRNYADIKAEYKLTTIANEYLVSDEQRYASSIDIVMQNAYNEICLVDTKTTWSLDKQSTGLQLSIYKRFFERQNPGLKVEHIFVLWMPNKDHSVCELHELSVVDDETIDALIDADQKDEPFKFELIPDEWAELERIYVHWSQMQKDAEEVLKSIKEQMMQVMENANIASVKTDRLTVSYIAPSKTKRFDSTLFKKENSDLYAKYTKEVETAAQLRVTPKKEKIN